MNVTPALRSFLLTLDNPQAPLSAATVEALAAEAPYFTLPAAIRLQRTHPLDISERRKLEARVALTGSSPEALTALLDADGSLWAGFYPPDNTPARPDTTDAITTFLETYGHGASPEDDALLERLIFNPQPDYASVLEERFADEPDQAPADEQTALIDAFLAKPHSLPAEPDTPAPAPARPVSPPAPAAQASDSSLSESLAKIYIRQRRYDKAYEIISHLNLNFPKKSAYFADQLRFLQKLMLNSRVSPAEQSDNQASTNHS